MKILERILRIALACFVIFYAGDIFFVFMSLIRPVPAEEAQEFLITLNATGYVKETIGAILFISGILLLFFKKRLVGLALVLLAPITFSLIQFHIFMDPSILNAIPGIILVVLHVSVAVLNRHTLASLVGK